MADVQLKVRVSELKGVSGFSLVFRGAQVPTNNGEGTITWDDTTTEWLGWHMVGDPAGTMRVEVLRGQTVISKRAKSRIPNSRPAGFDEIPIPQPSAAATAKDAK